MRCFTIVGTAVLVGLVPGCAQRARPCCPPAPMCAAVPAARSIPAQPPAPPAILGASASLPVPMAAVSGLAPIDAEHYLVVHDAKAPQPSTDPSAYAGVLTVRGTVEKIVDLAYEGIVKVDWKSHDPFNDLEGVCAVPGHPREFLVTESKPYGGKYGRVLHVRLGGSDGAWSLEVLGAAKLPAVIPVANDVEGIACAAQKDGSLLLFLGERGLPPVKPPDPQHPDPIPGTLYWGRIELAPGVVTITFRPHDQRALVATYADSTLPKRTCSDLFLDASGMLWGSACDDPGDAGPFRSAVYRIGTVTDASPPVAEAKLEVVRTLDGFKVEALSEGWQPGELCIGTDDEDYGGTWRRLLRPKP